MCTINRDDRKLENTVKQSRASQRVNWSWSQCIKSHHAQTSSGKGLPSHFWNRNIIRSILPGLRRKITGLLLSGPKSSFQMRVYFAFHLEIKVPESGGSHVEAQNPCCLKSSVKFPQSVMIWAAMSSAGVGPLCFLKSTVNAVVMGSSDSDLRVLFSKMNKSFFEFISFFLAKHNSNVTCYFPNTSTTYANVDHTTNNTKL